MDLLCYKRCSFPLLFSRSEADDEPVTQIMKLLSRPTFKALLLVPIINLALFAPLSVAEPTDVAVAKPVNAEPVQVFGWREHVKIDGVPTNFMAKLDTGATTSSIHVDQHEMFERDGKKWVRFVLTDPTVKKSARTRLEAPLVRIVKIKEPGGEPMAREVVKLGFQIGEHKLRGDFTLNNRSNMNAPVLIGRNLLEKLGVVDSSRTYIADQKIFK